MYGCKFGDREKKLASQLIGRFFKHFKSEQEKSFNCLLDLCDDNDPAIRKQAVHDLQQICKSAPVYVPQVSDILSQMLATDDSSEAHVISLVLFSLLETDPKNTLVGIFNQIISGNSKLTKENLIKFVSQNYKLLPESRVNTELEEFLVEYAIKVLRDVPEIKLIQVIPIISSLKCISSLQERQKLVNVLTDQVIQAVPDFNPLDASCIAHVREGGNQVARFLSKNASAGSFLKYVLTKVVPNISLMKNPLDQRNILHLVAKLCLHPGESFKSSSLQDSQKMLLPLYNYLMEVLPDVPSDPNQFFHSSGVSTLGDKVLAAAFTLECLLYALLNLVQFHPLFFGMAELAEDDDSLREGVCRLQSLRHKVQYLARLIQSHKSTIIARWQLTFNKDLYPDVTSLVVRSALENVEIMARCLLRNRIDSGVLGKVTPSWINSKPELKRSMPVLTSASLSTTAKRNVRQQFPQVPAGRWSKRFRRGGGRRF
ncbi:unnamed protein product [Mesocestoides corti]|uniref:Apoptosis inhibitor 5 n=2 Tax=Mesocestoides corti TaxID=53468 RepID=A0A3P6I4U8_MESCO|nr:unnamed protein product [Mesocestoides corti]